MEVATWLTFFGITPQQLTPLLLFGFFFALVAWKCFFRDLKQEVCDLHHATREIQMYIEDDDDDGWRPQHGLGTNPIFQAYGQSNSPTVPNENGKKFLKDTHFNKQYPIFQERLFKVMDDMKLRTLYDYERGAKKALRLIQDDPAFDPIKNYVVSHPDVTLPVIFSVAAWVIRDDYAKRKGV